MKRCPKCGYREPKPVSQVRRRMGLTAPKKRGMGCRIGERDDALKAARGYVEPGSFVRRDGSERLVGRDWRMRVEELRQRAGGGRCERIGPLTGQRCYNQGCDPDHKVKRSRYRDDRMQNLEWLCRDCHNLKHPEFKVRSGKLGA